MVAPMKCPRGDVQDAEPMMSHTFLLAVVALTAAQLGGCQPAGSSATAPTSSEHPLLGAAAPDFDLPRIGDVQGSPRFRSSDRGGKLLVVDFWATWCNPCRNSFPAYEQMSRERKGDTVFLGVSVDEEPNGIPAFIEETGVSFPVVWDESQVVAGAYEPPTMPTTFVVDQHGIVRFVHTGYRAGDEEQLAAVLDSLR